MDSDEKKVKNYLEIRGLTVEYFSRAEMRTGKTPDFRVFKNGKLLFYCEVKSSLKDRWLDSQLKNSDSSKLIGGSRSDPIFNRLSTHIHQAVKQFEAVNKDHQFPNVLALINHDDMSDFYDLEGVLTGNFYANDGITYPIYRQFSHGRIKDEKEKVDLFIWLDDHKPDGLFFSRANEFHYAVLYSIFRFNNR